MAEGGYDERGPLMVHTDDRNDDEDGDGDTTGPVKPRGTLTPAPSGDQIPLRTTTMNRPPKHGSHTAETSFIEGFTQGSRIFDYDSTKIEIANETLLQKHSHYGKRWQTFNP